MNSTELIATIILSIAMLPLVGFLLAATPWLMKRRECFAVTVPETAHNDARLRGFKVRYTAIMVAATVGLSAIALVAAFASAHDMALATMIAGILGLCALSFFLMLFFRRRVIRIKIDENWAAIAQEQVSVAIEGDMPRPLSLAWSWIYVAIAAITLAIGIVGYPSMPEMVPMHADLAGNVDRWEQKSPMIVLFPVLMQLFIGICVAFSHWTILRSKKGSDPEMPVASTLGYALFARAQSIFLVATGALVCAAMSLFSLSMLELVTMGQAAIALFVIIAAILVGAVAISVVYGQSGARAIKRVAEAGELRFDDDACWKLGVLYWNPNDASLFVPERFGIGWTMNFARPVVWGILIGGFALTIVFIVAVLVLF